MTRFYSDNVSRVCPEVFDSMLAANQGDAAAYGRDEITFGLTRKLSKIFECDVAVFLTTSGTVANALALSAITPVYGAIYCHRLAHINTDECGAPELFTGGAKLIPIDGRDGKITVEDLASHIFGQGVAHHARPSTLSLTQSTELGTLYLPDELTSICSLAKKNGLKIHMDGARFANALAAMDASPAEITWKAGVDVLSFGGTKNGCLMAEAVVFFDHALAQNFAYLHKRAGQLLSKMRFISAQFEAYLRDDLWLRNAARANRMAARLSHGLQKLSNVELAYQTQVNEVFARLPESIEEGLISEGFTVNRTILDSTAPRFVTSWDTCPEDIDRLLEACSRYEIRG